VGWRPEGTGAGPEGAHTGRVSGRIGGRGIGGRRQRRKTRTGRRSGSRRSCKSGTGDGNTNTVKEMEVVWITGPYVEREHTTTAQNSSHKRYPETVSSTADRVPREGGMVEAILETLRAV
jgi:hypothetical protein